MCETESAVSYHGVIIKETLSNESLLDFLTIEKVEIWKTDNAIRYWTMVWFSTDVPDFPEILSKMLIGGGWFADMKAENVKYIIFKDAVLKYTIGNAVEKDGVLNVCRLRGIPEHQLNWDE